MRWIALFVSLAVSGVVAGYGVMRVAHAATHFNRSVSVTGASPQQLSTLLAANGYAGPPVVNELTLLNPTGAANSLCVGQSDVSAANGYCLPAGASITWRASNQGDSIEPARIYLFVAVTQNAAVSLRSK